MKKFTLLTFFAALFAITISAQEITEIHYDNAGGDVGEGVEITGPAGTDLAGWSIVLYNGSATQLKPYGSTQNLSGIIPDEASTGTGAIWFPISGMQNGAPDGLALIDDMGNVVEFLSYEGSFTAGAGEGPAGGMTSTDIGVAETSSTPTGHSLQKTAGGTWEAPQANTTGMLNESFLPVELSAFNANLLNDKTVAITWTTASEENNDFFQVERSVDGENYETLGTVQGAGNSTQILDYYFKDNTPAALNYYRLKQVDFDGTSSYSDVQVVRLSKESNVFNIFPNPVKGNLNINMGTFVGEATFNVVDLSGKTILSQTNTVEGVQDINTENLSSGVYFVQIITGQEQSSIKFIKK